MRRKFRRGIIAATAEVLPGLGRRRTQSGRGDVGVTPGRLEVYAYQAKDAELMAWSAELHERAERKLGEVMAEERAAGKLAKPKPGSATDPGLRNALTLAQQDIDKHLADRARKAAAMPADKFEAKVAKTIAIAVAAG